MEHQILSGPMGTGVHPAPAQVRACAGALSPHVTCPPTRAWWEEFWLSAHRGSLALLVAVQEVVVRPQGASEALRA